MDEKDNPTVCSKTTEVTAYTLARQNLKTAASRQKEQYDCKHMVKPTKLATRYGYIAQ